jgi:hypothetical protein
MAHTQAVVETTPLGTDSASGGALELRNLKRDIRERMALEHVWTGADLTNDGVHSLGGNGDMILASQVFGGG